MKLKCKKAGTPLEVTVKVGRQVQTFRYACGFCPGLIEVSSDLKHVRFIQPISQLLSPPVKSGSVGFTCPAQEWNPLLAVDEEGNPLVEVIE